ncbi:MAG: PH domain-containing protein [Microbacteriaceae bacterium]|nr:PH domain-containing protein [Microbacteriaceae bacterium]
MSTAQSAPGPRCVETPPAEWRGNSPRYLVMRTLVVAVVWVLIVAVGTVVALLAAHASPRNWVLVAFPAITLIWGACLTVTEPRRVRAMGYLLREDDVVFRRGLWFRRQVAVPFGRLQLAELTKGPLDRMAGVSALRLVTASAGTDAKMPGLGDAEAASLRDRLIELAESRRAGL